MNVNDQIVIIGDSWSCGEWILDTNNTIKLNHPGLTEYLSLKTLNLSKGGASNWDNLFAMVNYMDDMKNTGLNYSIVVFQTDPIRGSCAEKFDVNIDSAIKKADNLEQLYLNLIEVFYIKLSELSKKYNVPVYIVGGLPDVNKFKFNFYNNESNIICESWLGLLYKQHKTSVIPLRFNSNFFLKVKKLGRLDLCDQILNHNDSNYTEYLEVSKLDTFGPNIRNFHPNRHGHRILADYINQFYSNKIDAIQQKTC